MKSFAYLFICGAVLGVETNPPPGFPEWYRFQKTEFDSKSEVVIRLESRKFTKGSKYEIVSKEIGKENIDIEYIPDSLSQEAGKEWRKGPLVRLGKLTPGRYLVAVKELPKCHRDPQPCTGAMWISPVLNRWITVK